MAWIYQRGGVWWLGYRVNGKQILRSTGTSDRKAADKELAKIKMARTAHDSDSLTQEFIELLTGKTVPKYTLTSELNAWHVETGKSAKSRTLEKYQEVGREFSFFLKATDSAPLLGDIDTDVVRDFLNRKLASTSTSTANHYRKILRVFFARAVNNSRIKSSPMAPIKTFKPGPDEEQVRRPFTAKEVQLIYSKAPDDFWRYMIISGFYTGARMGDLACCIWASVDFAKNFLRYTSRKTGKKVAVPMAANLRQILLARREQSPNAAPTSYVWPEQAHHYIDKRSGPFSNAFYEILANCGLVPPRDHHHSAQKKGRAAKRDAAAVTFHCLRYAFISLLKATGGSQSTAKQLAGHNSDVMSDHYTDIPEAVLIEAINQLPEINP